MEENQYVAFCACDQDPYFCKLRSSIPHQAGSDFVSVVNVGNRRVLEVDGKALRVRMSDQHSAAFQPRRELACLLLADPR